MPRVVAIFGAQSWCWEWAGEARALVFALVAAAAGQQLWQQLARQATLRGKQMAAVPVVAYRRCKDVSEAWAAGVLAVADDAREAWAERVAIMVTDGGLLREDAEQRARLGCQAPAAP